MGQIKNIKLHIVTDIKVPSKIKIIAHLIRMESDVSCIHYFLSCKSWEPHDEFANAGYSSNIVIKKQKMKRRSTRNTKNNRNKMKQMSNVVSMAEDSTSTHYLLCCRSWEPHEIFTDIGFYPSTLVCEKETTSNLGGDKEHETYQKDGREFNSGNRSSLQYMVHTGGEKLHKYMECDQAFSGEGELTKHLRRHIDRDIHTCLVCQKTFPYKYSLVNHSRVHTGEKPYECTVCHKRFSHKVNLTNHVRVHSGEKPFECIQCGKSFSQKGHMVSHSRIHTGEKPYKCMECCKSFSHKSTLKQHLMIHTGEKPYKCMECSKSFSHKSSLTTLNDSHR